MTKRAKKRNPKTILRLPDLEHSKNARSEQSFLREFTAVLRSCYPRLH